ncbi:MAG: RnfABCDGE type electron transport complex subunit B [wastewater metagenome]|nr:RnfABCDGE type electron transport complex subunit B [Candidatus Loosdrechtia aerotolerans]
MDFILGATITLGILGMIFGIGLAIASDTFAVKVDPRIDSINEILPGANCGACNQPGCNGFAQAVVEGKALVSDCSVGQATVAQRIANIMGVTFEKRERSISVVMCHARGVKDKFTYDGIKDCRAANIIGGGFLGCDYGCLGFGTCVEACKFEAMYMGKDGLPKVIEDRCTGCGKCAVVCPRNIISMVPESKRVHVRCKSLDKGAVARKTCQDSCIACKQCEKKCPYDAIHVQNNLAVIDYNKCTSCGKCVEVCPNHTIINFAREKSRSMSTILA